MRKARKLLSLALPLVLLAGASPRGVRAQGGGARPAAAAEAHGVEVLKFGWSKERLGWERDPFGGPLENFDEMRARARSEKRVDDAKRGGGGAEADRARREARADAANVDARRNDRPPRYAFLYKVTVRNASAKAVREFDWDYLFLDAATGEELGRRQFTAAGKIPPGKRKDFDFMIPAPPTRKVSAHALDRREREGVSEKIVIVRVLYEDGASWPP